MRTAIYTIWFLIPTIFFTIALWSKLEQLSGRERRENVKDYVSQGAFVLLCVLVSVIIDQYVLEDIAYFIASFLPFDAPVGFFQVMLLPVVLYAGAFIIGPSKAILIPRPDYKKKPPRKGR